MRLFLHVGLGLLFSFQAFSQEVTIPFRVGNVYGISDYNGKLVNKNKFDQISYNRKMPKGYFSFKNKEENGLAYNGKTLVSGPEYDEFGIEPNKFIIAVLKRNRVSRSTSTFKNEKEYNDFKRRNREGYALFNLKGETIYPDNFKKIIPVDTTGVSATGAKRARFALMATTNFDDQFSLFVYDCDKQKISEWLLKDYDKIKLDRGLTVPGKSIALTASKAKSDSPMSMQVNHIDGKFVLQPLTTEYRPGVKERFEKEYGTTELTGDPEYGSGTGKPNYTTEAVPPPPAYGTGVNATVPNDAIEKKRPKVVKQYIVHTFEIKDEKLFLKELIAGQKEAKTETEFPMPPVPAGQTYSFESFPYTSTTQDTEEKRVTQKNIIRFKSGDLYGMLLSQERMISCKYDSISPIKFTHSGQDQLLFVVGQKDVTTQTIQYGLIDSDEKVILPLMYEELDPFGLVKSFSKTRTDIRVYNKNWRFKQNGKYGIITAYDGIVLPAEYDEIEWNTAHFPGHQDDFVSLKKGGLYGFVLGADFKEANIVQPVFPYKIGFYDRNYQKEKGLLLFGLIDNDGKFFCYARKDGFLYYKAK
ncbi:hypothetical protein E6C50_02520 [Flavobacterium supellecticarium]|uniref:WG containing repeat-containing protein n=1 Tax=Flavobacterium supellecticarium TaxID=2565924 RepID=A0A4S4A3T6_9FLAO|nr:WG repeat-containing protein [Flavobacterium supellecticarium]THF53097.1 hypothetical protein E6C50_02520 [Flavobacterium supellecticarium]